MKKFLNFLFNVAWVIFVGIELTIGFIISGILSCICIVPIFFGIPKIYFEAIPLAFAPAGKTVELHFNKGTVRNIIYLIFGGAWKFIGLYIYGGLLCCTIIGIPLGLQLFKFAKYFIAPFGAEVK